MRRIAGAVVLTVAGVSVGAAVAAFAELQGPAMYEKLPPPDEIARLPADGGENFNRLIHASSPYLLQHARNPVDWYEWGEEAFRKARREDKPVFLSIGYSTCHWCHVMAEESFEDEEVAGILNENFVAVKVDREELPEVDEIYMNATQLVTGSGGWPNSLWLDHDKKPWFAGTYFPKEDSAGRHGFRTLLRQLARLWQDRREEVEKQADQLWRALERVTRRSGGIREVNRKMVTDALAALRDAFDPNFGGFGGAPKFPPHSGLRLILDEYDRTGDKSLLPMAVKTLDAMCRGGIRDHVGGGFHRYSTDARWLTPHFEKMLYDNAQLLAAYTDGFQATGREHYREVAMQICRWVIREMAEPGGGFYSGIDADSEGREGKFYTWTWDEVMKTLGKEDGALFAKIYGVRREGNFREEATGRRTGENVLYLETIPDRAAQDMGIAPAKIKARLDAALAGLRRKRETRVRPHTDDKVIAAWNGLMIYALAHAGRRFKDEEFITAAARAADFVLRELLADGRLHRAWRAGRLSGEGYLEDYALTAAGLLELHAATGRRRRLDEARALVDAMLERFRDASAGGFYFTADDDSEALLRYKDAFDKQVPSSNAAAALVLVRLAEITGEGRFLDEAGRTIEAASGAIAAAPRATETLVLAAARYLEASGKAGRPAARGMRPDARSYTKPVGIELYADSLRVAPGDTLKIAVRFEIDEGWHINSSSPPAHYLPATAVILEENRAAVVESMRYPEGDEVKFPFSDTPLSVYSGEVWVKGTLAVARSAPAGPLELRFEVHWQACDNEKCLEPARGILMLPVEITADAPRSRRHPEIFD